MKKNKRRSATGSSEQPEAPEREAHGSGSPADGRGQARADVVGDTPTGDADQPDGGDAEETNDRTAEAEALTEMQDRYLRLAAEFDNYRKRTERERSESWLRAQADLAGRLLDPLDDLNRVTDQDGAEASPDAVIEGIRLVERKLLRTLEDAGLETVQAAGTPFDPEIHEALMTVPAEAPEEDDTVADVFQKGYRFKGVLLRPARVRVKKFEE